MKNLLFLTLLLVLVSLASCDLTSDLKTPVTPVYTEQDSIVNFLEPADNVSYPEDSTFTITWYRCNNAFKYELQFSSDSLFTSPSSNWISSPTNYFEKNSGTCLSSCTYFYRIRAYFPPNNTSENYWSEIKRYNIAH